MRNRALGAVLGALAGVIVSAAAAEPRLLALSAFRELQRREPRCAPFARVALAWPWPFALGLVGAGVVRFAEVHGWTVAAPGGRVVLPPFPFEPQTTQLVLGEVHRQDGARCDEPRWLILPEKGMTCGILAVGATGASKTSGVHYPLAAQLLRLHALDEVRKAMLLVIDAKGNYAQYVRSQCEGIPGRNGDYYEISMDARVQYNVIGRDDLSAAALAGHLGDVIQNVQGHSLESPFWRQEAEDLAAQAIRLLRLVHKRTPTLSELYRCITSYDAFRDWVELALSRVDTDEERAEAESLSFWATAKAAKLDPKLRSAVAAGLNGVISFFDEPAIRMVFAPTPEDLQRGRAEGWRVFPGFDWAIQEGKVIALKLPYARHKRVSRVVGTLVKLNFMDAVLARLAESDSVGGHVEGRLVSFVADEFDGYVTQPGDGDFLAKCREARCCAILAIQSYESFVAKLGEHQAAQLLGNLRTKLFLSTEDNYTARHAADLCGQEPRAVVSQNRTESVQGLVYSWLDGQAQGQERGALSEGTTLSTRVEHVFPPRVLTRLRAYQAVVKAWDGTKVIGPTVVYLKPAHKDPNVSWFDDPEYAP